MAVPSGGGIRGSYRREGCCAVVCKYLKAWVALFHK